MLGHLGLVDARIDGLQNAYSNPEDPANPASPTLPVSMTDAVDGGPFDPPHDFNSITLQTFGFAKPVGVAAPVKMNGFLKAGGGSPFPLSAHNASNLPVLSALAAEYAVFDRWFAQPTCTNPNREYMMSATSHGALDNNFPAARFPQKTHFAFLEEHGFDWRIFYSDDTWMVPAFQDLQTPARLAKVQDMANFYAALKSATLPAYALIQPRMGTSKNGPSNWQHPDNSVAAGEALIADVVTALQASAHWNDTLLFITYDEHGGFFDHYPSPVAGIPSPDGVAAPNGFAFDRLGVRVPAVAVSPWIARGTVVHEPAGPAPSSHFDHSSIVATVNRILGIAENMTARDAWAGRFDSVITATLRADAPPPPRALPVPAATLAREARTPLNDHHLHSVEVGCRAAPAASAACAGHAGARALAAALAAAGAAPRAGAAALAAAHPAVDAAVLALLVQEDFEGVVRPLWAAYVAGVAARAA